jgi:hypothetical protein
VLCVISSCYLSLHVKGKIDPNDPVETDDESSCPIGEDGSVFIELHRKD